MIANRSAFLTICVFSLLASNVLAQAKTEPGKSTTSRIEKKTYEFKDAMKDMEYAQFVPSGYDKSKKTPLMVCLHGLGSNPQQMIRYKGLTDLAEKHGYILVAPMGYNPGGWYGAKPPFKLNKKDPENLSELSEKDVMNVLDLAKKDFNVDPKRIYLMGHSMGGGGTLHLAIKHPEIWAGLAPIAPAIFRPAADIEKVKKTPVIFVQGGKDILVPATGTQKWVDQMKKLEMTHEYKFDPEGDHINIAAKFMPDIFEFFEKHAKK